MAGRPCTVCEHPRRKDIELAMAGGGSGRGAAKAYGLSEASLRRHREHATPVVVPETSTAPPKGAVVVPAEGPKPVDPEPELPLDDLEGRLRQLARAADRLRRDAEHGDLRARGAALGEARRTVESMADIAKELAKGAEVRLLESKQWAELKSLVLDALRAFPDARVALLEALET